MIDCTEGRYRNSGCHGGSVVRAFQYVAATGGIEAESTYPYEARLGPCQPKPSKFVFEIKGYARSTPYDSDALKAAVARQPVAVGVNTKSIQFYKGGIMKSVCGEVIDHAVLVVGYGSEGGELYWKVKNSFGASWGEDGYFRAERKTGKAKSPCNICNWPVWPTA